MRHELKTWPPYFQFMVDGTKAFELRLNDRDFQMGDILYLREYDPETQKYTGRSAEFEVTYCLFGGKRSMTAGKVALHDEFVIMSVRPKGA